MRKSPLNPQNLSPVWHVRKFVLMLSIVVVNVPLDVTVQSHVEIPMFKIMTIEFCACQSKDWRKCS